MDSNLCSFHPPLSFRTIKLSSPNINNIVILGSIMTFTSVVLMGTDARIVSLENMDTICRVSSHLCCLLG